MDLGDRRLSGPRRPRRMFGFIYSLKNLDQGLRHMIGLEEVGVLERDWVWREPQSSIVLGSNPTSATSQLCGPEGRMPQQYPLLE